MMTKRTLIIGGGGFVGGHLINHALLLGQEVWVSVRSASTLAKDVDQQRIHIINLPVNDADALTQEFNRLSLEMGGWHYVIHNLGLTKTLRIEQFHTVNFCFMRNVVQALCATGTLLTKFVYISSLGAMGPGNEDGTPIRPTDTPHPNTRYGQSKLMAEEYLALLPHFPHLIIRPTGVYGPNDTDYFTLIKGISQGIAFQAGAAEQLISFTYVKDLAQNLFMLLESDSKNATYTISDNQIYTITQFNQLVKKLLGNRYLITVCLPKWMVKTVCYVSEHFCRLLGITTILNTDKARIMCARNWSCDCSSLYRTLHFTPTPLEEGLRETILWYRQHRWLRSKAMRPPHKSPRS